MSIAVVSTGASTGVMILAPRPAPTTAAMTSSDAIMAASNAIKNTSSKNTTTKNKTTKNKTTKNTNTKNVNTKIGDWR